jgi:anti-sigma factor RsiW
MSVIECGEFRKFIDPYIDGEFDDTERAMFDAHLAICPECRRYFDQRAWLQNAVKPVLKRPCRMPQEARGRLEKKLRAARRPIRARRAVRRFASPASAVVAAGAIFLLVTPLTGFKPSVVDEVLDQHCQQMPVEVPTPAAQELDRWFAGKLPFEMEAPDFRDGRVSLLGGRLSRIRHLASNASAPAAHLIYSVGSHKMSVLIFDGRGVVPFEEPDLHVRGAPMRVHEARGHQVALYSRGNLTYAVTSNLPRGQMLELIGSTL